MKLKHAFVTALFAASTALVALPAGSAAADDQQQLAAFVGISSTFDRYAQGFDESDWSMFGDAFAQDAVMDTAVGGKPGSHYPGRTSIIDGLRKGREAQNDSRRHVITNVHVTSLNGRSARVYAYYLLVVTLKGPSETRSVGAYDADMVQENDGSWRFKRLLVKLDAPHD
jgi:hypothetical protein